MLPKPLDPVMPVAAALPADDPKLPAVLPMLVELALFALPSVVLLSPGPTLPPLSPPPLPLV